MKQRNGFSILETIIAVSILAGVVFVSTKFFSGAFRLQTRLKESSELESLRYALAETIDCAATFTGLNPATQCTTSWGTTGQDGATFFPLRRQTQFGTKSLGVAQTDGSVIYGEWTLRASCSSAEGTMVLRAAKPLASGGFEKDVATGEDWNWSNPKGLLFGPGDKGAIPHCFTVPTKIQTGTYTGNGAASLSIASVGFSPTKLELFGINGAGVTYWKKVPPMTQFSSFCDDPQVDSPSIMGMNVYGWNFYVVANQGIRLDTTGFTVQNGSGTKPCDNSLVNTTGLTYHWVAFP